MTALLIIATCVVLGLVLIARVPGEAMWAADLTNFAHGPAFALVTVLLFKALRGGPTRQSPALPEYLVVTLIALALGVSVELVQGKIGRDASFDDFVRDAQGILAALGFLMLLDPKLRGSRGRRRARYAALLLGLTGATLLVWPLIVTGLAYVDRDQNFPVLADFDRPRSTYFVNPLAGIRLQRRKLPPTLAGHAQESHALWVKVPAGSWWGLMLREPVPDWRRFERLAVTVANPSPEVLQLELRVYDSERKDDTDVRFSTTLEIPPSSWRTNMVPLASMTTNSEGRGVDLAQVHSLMLARKGASGATEFYLARLWLE